MAARSSWKGFLKLSLVSMPVKAYSATSSGSEVSLNQLHKECHSRIQYKKTCPIHGEIGSDEIVLGYEYSKGQYVVIDPEEVNKLRAPGDQSIAIQTFINPEALDPMHMDKNYFLVPDGAVAQRPFNVLQQGMADLGKVAIAQVVLSNKEQVVLLRPVGQLIAMSTLRFDHEVKKAVSFDDEVVHTDVADDELELMERLIEQKTATNFDFSIYHDVYTEKLTKLIAAKVEGKEIVTPPPTEEPNIINLMDALRASVQRAAPAAKKPAPTAKPKAPALRQAKPPKKMAPSKPAMIEKKKRKTS